MRTFVIIFLLFSSLGAAAQEPQSWLIYFGQSQIKESRFYVHHELQLRDHQLLGDHNQSLVRVGGQYRFSPQVTATLGYAFVYSEAVGSPNSPFNEHRIYQELLAGHAIKRARVRHRFRLEERFIDDRAFRGRARYCLFGDIPLTKNGFAANGVYLAFYNEIFINISADSELKAFDRNRAYGGVGYKAKDNLGVQLGYMRQHVGEQSGTDHVVLSLHHQMKWE